MARELEWAGRVYDLSKVKTVFAGGGTPSMLAPDLWDRIAASLPAMDRADVEFTIEVNPATVTPAKAMAWRKAGANRISLGAQSFDAGYLKLLGRQHSPSDIVDTLQILRDQGFRNCNLDLMYALPSQPVSTWEKTLEAALECAPQHVSAYALTYEEDTPFFEALRRGQWTADESTEAAMFEKTVDVLQSAGLDAYEISNFAMPGYESRHNRAYWQGKDYLGFGPSAWSTIEGQRWMNLDSTGAYCDRLLNPDAPAPAIVLASLRENRESLTSQTLTTERIMLGLRTREGISANLLAGRLTTVDRLIHDSLAYWHDQRLVLTRRGRLVADSIAEILT
jgi:oxygen-independent coproporphyrinogen-3 oxidase